MSKPSKPTEEAERVAYMKTASARTLAESRAAESLQQDSPAPPHAGESGKAVGLDPSPDHRRAPRATRARGGDGRYRSAVHKRVAAHEEQSAKREPVK